MAGIGNSGRSGLDFVRMDRRPLLSPLHWHRAPRSQFNLDRDNGLYALFLRDSAELSGITPGAAGLLYIGLAASRQGLKGRCHFNASTRNHSPRKSLAVLLMEPLALEPVLVVKPGSRNTWSLTPASEQRLTNWMHENLDLAIFPCPDPELLETKLIGLFAPPLNLAKCEQTAQHRTISTVRSDVLIRLEAANISLSAAQIAPKPPLPGQLMAEARIAPPHARRDVGLLDTAEAIAAHFELNPKSYRQRLREGIAWYRKPQVWTFSPGSPEWNDMIAIAEKMAGRKL